MTNINPELRNDPRFQLNYLRAGVWFVVYVIFGVLIGLVSGAVGRSIGGDVGTIVRLAMVILLSPVGFMVFTSILIGLNLKLGWSPFNRKALGLYFAAIIIPAVFTTINVL